MCLVIVDKQCLIIASGLLGTCIAGNLQAMLSYLVYVAPKGVAIIQLRRGNACGLINCMVIERKTNNY